MRRCELLGIIVRLHLFKCYLDDFETMGCKMQGLHVPYRALHAHHEWDFLQAYKLALWRECKLHGVR